MEKHRICFRDVETGWYNALPLGNGSMGAMVYYRNKTLCIALNHYDCYYHVLEQYAGQGERTEAADTKTSQKPESVESGNGAEAVDTEEKAGFDDPARRERTYEELCAAVEEARKKSGYERSHYVRTLNPEQALRPVYGGGSYPQGGEVQVFLSEEMQGARTVLELVVENAKVRFSAQTGGLRAEAEIWVDPEQAGVLIRLRETKDGLWERAGLWRQEARGQGKYIYEDCVTSQAYVQTCLFRPDGENADTEFFVQETALWHGSRFDCELEQKEQGQSERGGRFLTASIRPGRGNAVRAAEALYKNRWESALRHEKKWNVFWKSSVALPDKYLETLWHLYIYLIECGSGSNSVHSEQACGLSGLWDIRRPCMWGSMWYWDVNIQTAFYGSFGANHMEHIKGFCDAFLSYREEAHRFAKRIYGKTGWALDYPHPLYHCIQPWCALFLWKYYAYTKDETFLREQAYPAFLEMLRFYEQISSVDAQGKRHIDYDICPEQGPVARDTVITVAALRQLAEYALHSAKILERPEEECQEIAGLLMSMPEYARTKDGKRWKDSELVQDDIFLRHPSVLMPVFPAEEVHMKSGETLKSLAEETIRYASENTEAGTFGFEWIAAAAARMGAGESAVRILYENGLDFVTHSNGLGYEESERFINYCHLTKPANYLPVMCEEAGGTTAVINLLLLQEIDGVIHVFPAIPDGKDRYARPKTSYLHDDALVSMQYGPWENCGFEGLLASGGFEVSAQMRGGGTMWIRVKSKAAGMLRLSVPKNLETNAKETAKQLAKENKSFALISGKENDEKTLEIFLEEGEVMELGTKPREPEEKESEHCAETQERGACAEREETPVLVRRAARTHRRIFLGEDRHTRFYKAVDGMVCPYGYAERLRYEMTPYVFDFTEEAGKNYDDVYASQILEAGRAVLYAGGPRSVGADAYRFDRGYGFLTEQKTAEQKTAKTTEQKTEPEVCIRKRKQPDSMRRDFAEGTKRAVFGVELPAGKYDILVVSGDENEASVTHIGIPKSGVYLSGDAVAAGEYQCRVIPVMHTADGILEIVLDTEAGMKWKVNAIFINKEYLLL